MMTKKKKKKEICLPFSKGPPKMHLFLKFSLNKTTFPEKVWESEASWLTFDKKVELKFDDSSENAQV